MTSQDVWFTSDLHFGHANIIRYCNRPFDSVDEMNEALIENWNSVVKPRDRVWLLGDIFMGKKSETMPLAKRLNGDKLLVPGNHDGCHPMYDSADRESKRNKYLKACEAFQEVGFVILAEHYGCITFGDVKFDICHFPYQGDSHDADRYEKWRPVDDGSWQLCGHVHDAWKTQDRSINVGTDVWDYTPVHIDELLEMTR